MPRKSLEEQCADMRMRMAARSKSFVPPVSPVKPKTQCAKNGAIARSEERTAHGLWIAHKAIAMQRLRDPSFDWCAHVNAGGYIPLNWAVHRYSKVYMIRRCADRYCRRYHLKTVRQYNSVIDRICDRLRANWGTRKAAFLNYPESAQLTRHQKRVLIQEQFNELKETEYELLILQSVIRNAQSALRSATQ